MSNRSNLIFAFAVFAAVAFFTSLVFMFFSIYSFVILKSTGFATSVGEANLTVEATITINFTTAQINWGSGRVNDGFTSAGLNTLKLAMLQMGIGLFKLAVVCDSRT